MASVEIRAGYRGAGAVPEYWSTARPRVQGIRISHSWGSEPARGEVDIVSASYVPTPIPAGATVRVSSEYGHLFYGVVVSDNPIDSSGGQTRTIEFADFRYFLDMDVVWGTFNMVEKRLVNGRRTKRYWHVLPRYARTGHRIYTTTPFTVQRILQFLLRWNQESNGNPTVETPWLDRHHGPVWHAAQGVTVATASGPAPMYPVLNVQFDGERLGAALVKLCERQGLTFTLAATDAHPFRLWFARQGEGVLPVYDIRAATEEEQAGTGAGTLRLGESVVAGRVVSCFPRATNERRLGSALSGNPSRVCVLGGRNLYQVLNVPLQADWNMNWARYYDLDLLVDYVFKNLTVPTGIGDIAAGTRYNAIPGDTEWMQGWQLAGARARTMTVGEFAAVRTDLDFSDRRMFGGRSRMEMPAALYIHQVLFRAFRPASPIGLPQTTGQQNNGPRWTYVNVNALRLVGEGLAKVGVDPGAVSSPQFFTPGLASEGGNGVACVQGYNVGQDLFRLVEPSRFNIRNWIDAQKVWQTVNFQIDDGGGPEGGFLVFDEPVIRSEDLLTEAEGPSGMKLVVFRANPVFTVPPAVGALTFAGPRYAYWRASMNGSQLRDHVESVPDLYQEIVVNGSAWHEMAYVDGQGADWKADQLALGLLQGPYAFAAGGYRRPLVTGDAGTVLSPVLNRVTLNYGPNGVWEEVDFSTERRTQAFIPEPEFDRRRMMEQLLPGEAELRSEARQMQLVALGLRQSPMLVRTMRQAFFGPLGTRGELGTVYLKDATGGTLAVGTPIWKRPGAGPATTGGSNTETQAIRPAATDATCTVFCGVTVREGELEDRPLAVHGRGLIYARVKGPVGAGEAVGLEPGQDYLVGGAEVMVGTVTQEVTGTGVVLCGVRVGGAVGSGTGEAVWL